MSKVKTYTYEEVLEDSKNYFSGNELAAKVFIDKYALRNNEDKLLESNPSQMHKRVAKEIARIERKKFKNPLSEEEIVGHLEYFKSIIPQGSILYGVGNPYRYVSLSNCFVVDTYDSYGGIFYTDEMIAQISKRRGGIGFDISSLRPKSMGVTNSARFTTGAVSFMHRFSNTSREVGQNGRRAAELMSISVHHPDVLDFASIKNDEKSVTGANISIKLTDEFMEAVLNNKEYEQRWPIDSITPDISYMVSAKEVWNKIIHSAWLRGEPGLLNFDLILKESPLNKYGEEWKELSTNPCGEIPLSKFGACRLLVINLFNCVDNPYTSKASFNYDKLYKTAQTAHRLMDDIVDLEIECINRIIRKIKKDPEPKHIKSTELHLWQQIKKRAIDARRVGIGPTALGDTIAALNINYGSNKSTDIAEDIYKTIKLGCYRSSVDIAKELGPFPIWKAEKDEECPFLTRIKEEDKKLWNDMQRYGRRNGAILTTAPCGTVSIMACLEVCGKHFHNTTSGIEPLFLDKYKRRKKVNPDDEGTRVDFVDKVGDSWMEFDVFHEGINAWHSVNPKKNKTNSPYSKSLANDIDCINKVKMQGRCQKHVDHSISNSYNLPNDVLEKDVADIYIEAYKQGCKGITVYRDGCRSGVLISDKKQQDTILKTQAPKRPKELPCDVHHITVKGQPYFVLVGMFNDEPYEVFAGKNGVLSKKVKSGKIIKRSRGKYRAELDDDSELSPITAFTTEEEDVITRVCSTALRHGAPIEFLQQQLEKTKGDLQSFAKCIARTLKKYVPDGTEVKGEECPECGDILIIQEGCKRCKSCSFSKCN